MDDLEIVEFTLVGHSSSLEVVLHSPFLVPKDAVGEIGLKCLSFYHSVPNIDESNNSIYVRISGEDWIGYTYQVGSFEIDEIADALMQFLYMTYPMRRHEIEDALKISGNVALGKTEIRISLDGYAVSFRGPNSIAPVLGFEVGAEIVKRGIHVSPKLVRITNVSTILCCCNIAEANFVNSEQVPCIYTTILNVSPGHRFRREIQQITYKRMTTGEFSILRFWITDSEGRLLNLRNERIAVTLSVRLRKSQDV